MSMVGTLARLAATVLVSRGVGRMMRGGRGTGGGLGGLLGGALGQMGRQPMGRQGGQQGGLGGLLGGILGGGHGRQGTGGQDGGLFGGGQQQGGVGAGGALGGLGAILGGQGGQQGGLGGILDQLTGGNNTAQQGTAQSQTGAPQQGGLGALLNQAFSGQQPQASAEQEDQARLLMKAMLNATKADGHIDEEEKQNLLQHMQDSSPEDQAFIQQELNAPLDLDGLVSEVPQGMESQVYMMSLLAINLDSPAEAQYLQGLATKMNLNSQVTSMIHQQVGVPALS